jgi:hypothetical protein
MVQISFSALPYKKTWWQLTSQCWWNCVRHLTCFLSSLCTKKRLSIWHMNRPLSNNTTDSALRHREVGWTKDLSAPPNIRTFSDSYLHRDSSWCCTLNMPIYVWTFLHTNNVTALKYQKEIYCQSTKTYLYIKISLM